MARVVTNSRRALGGAKACHPFLGSRTDTACSPEAIGNAQAALGVRLFAFTYKHEQEIFQTCFLP